MKNNHIIVESNLTQVVVLYQQKNYPFIYNKNSKEWSLKCY
jgi:hypothetical protein